MVRTKWNRRKCSREKLIRQIMKMKFQDLLDRIPKAVGNEDLLKDTLQLLRKGNETPLKKSKINRRVKLHPTEWYFSKTNVNHILK